MAGVFDGMGSALSLLRNGLSRGPAQSEPSQDILVGEAHCSCSIIDGRCSVRLRGNAVLMELPEESREDVVDISGAHVEYSGTSVSLSCDSTVLLNMSFDADTIAFRWATKLAVAAGDMESITELFSLQDQKIDELERHTEEAQSNNDQIERCLNFLSKEYVDFSHEARSSKVAPKGTMSLLVDPKDGKEVDLLEAKDKIESPPEFTFGKRHTSEPEQEP